jgi:DNA-binding CsgD family transcriptional regulator
VVSRTLQRGEARFSLLETIRQYGQEKLKAAGEWEPMRDRHRQRYMQLAEETATKLTGQYEHLWLDWLEGEHDNIRAALAWSLESNHIEAGLRIANSLYQFWTIRDYVVEGLAWTEQLLERAGEDVALIVRVNALAYASLLAGFRGNRTAQIRYGQEAASLAEAAGDAGKPALGWALAGQFWAAWAAGDFQTTFDLMKRAIQIHREVEDTYQLGMALTLSSFPAMTLGLFEEAQALMDEGLPLLRQVGNPYRLAMALNYAGDLARCKGNYAQAQSAYEECIAILRGLDAVRDLASALHNLGHTCLHLRDVERAHALLSESLSIQQALRNTPGVAECLIGYAALAVARGLPGAGARLLAAAVSIGGERVATAWAATRMEYEHTLSLICTGLTDSNFEAEQVAGRAFSLAQAVDYARNLPLAAIPTAQNKLGDLTTREREIAALIARGRSNGEIADELVVSKRTVEKHVANILSKLAFTNRAQIVRWAIEAGLVQSDE